MDVHHHCVLLLTSWYIYSQTLRKKLTSTANWQHYSNLPNWHGITYSTGSKEPCINMELIHNYLYKTVLAMITSLIHSCSTKCFLS